MVSVLFYKMFHRKQRCCFLLLRNYTALLILLQSSKYKSHYCITVHIKNIQ